VKFDTRALISDRIAELHDLLELNKRDMQVLLTRTDSKFRSDMQEQFKTEGASGGSKWPPLSEKYRKRKQRKRPGRKILVWDGTLRDSLTTTQGDHVRRWFRVAKGYFIRLGTQNSLAAYHGPGTYHNDRLPVRDPMQMTDVQQGGLINIIREYLTKEKLKQFMRAKRQLRKARSA
jgi:phage gpG-like protein